MPDIDVAWRRENVGHLLFAATDRCVRRKLDVVHRGGFLMVTEAQMALFVNLDAEGTRLTTLAARAGLTKQSMIELIDRAEAHALVRREPDPEDKRAKIVLLTPRGRALLAQLHRGIIEAEREVGQAVGGAFLRELKRRLLDYAGRDAAAVDAARFDGDAAWRTNNVGRLFALGARRFGQDVLGAVHERGYREVTEVLLTLFRQLDLDGARLTDIASQSRMTKQSMRELVDRAEVLGLVAREGDRADKRAKLIRFTAAGLDMLEDMRRGVVRAEAALAEQAGAAFVAALKLRLPAYAAGTADDHSAEAIAVDA